MKTFWTVFVGILLAAPLVRADFNADIYKRIVAEASLHDGAWEGHKNHLYKTSAAIFIFV